MRDVLYYMWLLVVEYTLCSPYFWVVVLLVGGGMIWTGTTFGWLTLIAGILGLEYSRDGLLLPGE